MYRVAMGYLRLSLERCYDLALAVFCIDIENDEVERDGRERGSHSSLFDLSTTVALDLLSSASYQLGLRPICLQCG